MSIIEIIRTIPILKGVGAIAPIRRTIWYLDVGPGPQPQFLTYSHQFDTMDQLWMEL